MAAADLYRRGAKTVLGEHAGDRAAGVERDQREVAPIGLADSRFGNAEAHAGNGEEGFGGGSGVIDGHFFFSS